MRTCLKAFLVVGCCIALQATVPEAVAADLAVTPKKAQHKRVRVVRDYDGTPIMLRRARPMLVRGYDGTARVLHEGHLDEAIPVPRAVPTRYLNGQPVRPTDRILYTRILR